MLKPLELALALVAVVISACLDDPTPDELDWDTVAHKDYSLRDAPEPDHEAGDDDPTIYPEEVVAPAMDWQDAGWEFVWFDDPSSVNCEAAPAWCQSEAYQTAIAAQGAKDA